eukprot:CAMPEP_0114539974 /NCGR_PEP_ID=MMETSP0114-20121206/521_1 /TAXON_ID=31324 /ORGANISM="Goniomonas sp, Strain m" /LENGTH=140 /DNA_ID=CAMNT_0001724107 /DNA_START=8 /DNA_END=430 /DNA_ORIENTATION=+
MAKVVGAVGTVGLGVYGTQAYYWLHKAESELSRLQAESKALEAKIKKDEQAVLQAKTVLSSKQKDLDGADLELQQAQKRRDAVHKEFLKAKAASDKVSADYDTHVAGLAENAHKQAWSQNEVAVAKQAFNLGKAFQHYFG